MLSYYIFILDLSHPYKYDRKGEEY